MKQVEEKEYLSSPAAISYEDAKIQIGECSKAKVEVYIMTKETQTRYFQGGTYTGEFDIKKVLYEAPVWMALSEDYFCRITENK
jgi:hypothetical protein